MREIGRLINEDAPQKVKHHLLQLSKKGLINFDPVSKFIEPVTRGANKISSLVNVPILGAANCGVATMAAQQDIEGYLRIADALLPRPYKNIFAIRAIGDSMNKANINGKSIDSGDLVIVNSFNRAVRNGDYVLSVIDGMANIKRIYFEDDKIALISESTEKYPPIYIFKKDMAEYLVNGKIIDVMKNIPPRQSKRRI